MSTQPAESPYVEGMCVVPGQPGAGKARRGRAQYRFTLHYDACMYAKRSTTKMPAPSTPYPNTLPCQVCRPSGGGHTINFVRVGNGVRADCSCGVSELAGDEEAARQRVYRRHHESGTGIKSSRRSPTSRPKRVAAVKLSFTFTGEPNDEVRATCTGCGRSAVAATRGAARVRVYREHRKSNRSCADRGNN